MKNAKNRATLEREQKLAYALSLAEQLTAEQLAEVTPLSALLRILRIETARGRPPPRPVTRASLRLALARQAPLERKLRRFASHTPTPISLRHAEVQTELEALRLKKAAAKVLN